MEGAPRVGLMLALEPDFLVASQPLFEAGAVGALSLSVDFLWMRESLPDWARGLIDAYRSAGALYGHAIHYSVLSNPALPENLRWLDDFRRSDSRVNGLSAHFGLSLVPGYVRGAPLPLPFSTAAVAAGRHWVRALATAGFCVGLENLALAFSAEDCLEHGRFLTEILELGSSSERFVALDVHNVFCQAQNFAIDPHLLLASYPLDRVRELHVSGGSIGRSPAEPGRDVRQDTHDEDVPAAVFELASWVVARAPALEAVFFERLGGTIGVGDELRGARFRDDYARLVACVEAGMRARAAGPPAGVPGRGVDRGPIVDEPADLAAYETLLVRMLAEDRPPADVRAALVAGAPPPYKSRLERAELRMLDLGGRVVREWFEVTPP